MGINAISRRQVLGSAAVITLAGSLHFTFAEHDDDHHDEHDDDRKPVLGCSFKAVDHDHDDDDDHTGTPQAAENPAASIMEHDPIIIRMYDDYTFEPNAVDVYAGQPIIAHNVGILEHEIVVEEWGGDLTPEMEPDEYFLFTIPCNVVAGEKYEFFCAIPGHRENGMIGEFTIVE